MYVNIMILVNKVKVENGRSNIGGSGRGSGASGSSSGSGAVLMAILYLEEVDTMMKMNDDEEKNIEREKKRSR